MYKDVKISPIIIEETEQICKNSRATRTQVTLSCKILTSHQ